MKKLALLFFLFSSCAPVYVPNIRNSPMFRNAGEFQGTAQVGNGFDGQAAVSVTNHIGFMSNYSYINRNRYDTDHKNGFLKHRYFEGGLGYFKNDSRMFFELFVGYGTGQGSSYDTYAFFGTNTVQATGKYQRYFIQPAFGFNKGTMNVSFVPRFSLVDFTEFSSGPTSITDTKPGIGFFEPAVIGRVNMSNHFFFTFQGGLSVALDDTYFDHRGFQMSAGLGFRLNAIPVVVNNP
jgi:hypothetical protein